VFLGTELWERFVRTHYRELRRVQNAFAPQSLPDFDLPSAHGMTKAGLAFYDIFLQHFAASSHLQDFALRSLEDMSVWLRRATNYMECRDFLKIASFPPGSVPNAMATLLRVRKRLISLLRAELVMQLNVRRGESSLSKLHSNCKALIDDFEEVEGQENLYMENLKRLSASLTRVLGIIKNFMGVAQRSTQVTKNLVAETMKATTELTQRTDEIWPFRSLTTARETSDYMSAKSKRRLCCDSDA